MPDPKGIIADLRRYAGRQKTSLIFRIINPARYCFELTYIRLRERRNSAVAQTTRVALVSDLGAYTSEEQFHPFSAYRADLRNKLGVISLHLLLKDVLRAPKVLSAFDIIFLKMSFRTSPSEALGVVRAIRNASADKRIIYFDGDDDLCVQWPEILPYVDGYIKKHMFSDKSNYLKRFIGKSNLHDYVHQKYGYSFSAPDFGNSQGGYTMISESGPVPADQLGKIGLGFNLALDRYIMEFSENLRHRLPSVDKDIDIIFRGSVASENWSYYMRKDIVPVLRRLQLSYRVIMPDTRVTRDEYYREMMSSKVCISPFGYGEICWRDFEAVLCGCLLIKPDMSHVKTRPDIFKPYKTYVPVKWDFSDLEEKCLYYLTHERERKLIIEEAFKVLDEFYRNDALIKSVSELISVSG